MRACVRICIVHCVWSCTQICTTRQVHWRLGEKIIWQLKPYKAKTSFWEIYVVLVFLLQATEQYEAKPSSHQSWRNEEPAIEAAKDLRREQALLGFLYRCRKTRCRNDSNLSCYQAMSVVLETCRGRNQLYYDLEKTKTLWWSHQKDSSKKLAKPPISLIFFWPIVLYPSAPIPDSGTFCWTFCNVESYLMIVWPGPNSFLFLGSASWCN